MDISPLRLLVCGGRAYWGAKTLNSVLSRIQKRCSIAVIIHGAAQGADKLARRRLTKDAGLFAELTK